LCHFKGESLPFLGIYSPQNVKNATSVWFWADGSHIVKFKQ